MDKLTTEQKAKRYDEAIEKLRSLHDDYDTVSTLIDIKEELENIFPELAETDDERIRRVIRGWIYTRPASFFDNGISKEVMLAWLEKQGEQNLIMADSPQLGEQKSTDKFKVGDWVVSGQFVTQIREIAGDGYVNSHNGFIPFESAKNYHIWTIQDAKDGDVLATSAGAFIYNGNNGGGSCPGSYCGIDTSGNFKVGVEHHWTGKPVFPATKEQRDLLFQKMKEAGCMFDFEKKELKKLGQPEVTKTSDQEEIAEIPFGAKDSELQEAIYNIPKGFHAEIDNDKVVIKKGEKPTAWSDEDERNMQNIDSVLFYDKTLPEETCVKLRDFLKTLKERVGCEANCTTTKEWSEEDESQMQGIIELLPGLTIRHNWLKSLKDRIQLHKQWKTSEEQVKAFEHFVRSIGESGYASPYENNTKFLYSLLEQLKKL